MRQLYVYEQHSLKLNGFNPSISANLDWNTIKK